MATDLTMLYGAVGVVLASAVLAYLTRNLRPQTTPYVLPDRRKKKAHKRARVTIAPTAPQPRDERPPVPANATFTNTQQL